MKYFNKNIFQILMLLIITTVFTSCVKDEFDAPPTGCQDPALSSNITIKDLKDNYFIPGSAKQITEDLIIKGIVIADDPFRKFI